MIQRIQSIFLLIAIVAQSCFLFMPLWKGGGIGVDKIEINTVLYSRFSVSEIVHPDKGVLHNREEGTQNMILEGVSAVIFIGSLACLFLYRRRKPQANLARLLALFCVVIFGEVFYLIKELGGNYSGIQPASFLPILSIIMFLLAARAILKDEALVRSADRLR
ncbi:MAG: DUF4293 domain-containing protein [Bacteroidetes bacterium]|nr:DUF4293 domain-containing protein [Bacteroidota bacterium]